MPAPNVLDWSIFVGRTIIRVMQEQLLRRCRRVSQISCLNQNQELGEGRDAAEVDPGGDEEAVIEV
eukprot:694615-Hanusia_phi.AAC.1